MDGWMADIKEVPFFILYLYGPERYRRTGQRNPLALVDVKF